MSYLNDPREMAIRPESGVTLEEDNRYETMYHWGAHVLDLCDLPVEEYMKPMTVNVNGGGGGGGDDEEPATKTYSLKFMLDGVQKGNTYKLEEGAPIPEVSGEKEGYDFSGWKDASGNTPTVMPASNLTLYGTTTIKKFTVKFVVDGNELPEYEQVVNWNTALANIPASAKTGYTFSGWEPAIPAKIKSDYTFVGTFTKKTYNVSFNISGQVQTAQFAYGDTITYPAADSKEGYTICGWTPYYETMPDTDNVVFKAVLSANSYTVRYLIDFGEDMDNEIVAEYSVKYGQAIPSQALPVQSGYSFSQWSADTQVTGNKMPARNVNFYTTRTVNNYTLTYYVDGVQEGAAETYSYGAPVSTRSPYEREGYTATNWEFEPSLDIITDDMGIGYSMPYSNVVATCETSINSYNVVIKYGNNVIYRGTAEYGASIAPLIPVGYSYTGETLTVPAHDIELSVNINSYTVTVNVSGGSPIVLTLEYGTDIEAAVEEYIEDNLSSELVGHHVESNIPAGATVPAQNVSYELAFVPNQHTVTVSGGTNVTLNYGDNILEGIEGSVEIDEYHYIDEWLMNGQPLTENDTMPDEDITVVPVILTKESEVTPVISGETGSGSTTYDYGTPISEVIQDIIENATPEMQADLEDPGYQVDWTVNGEPYVEGMVVEEDEVTVEATITPKPFKLSFMRRASDAAGAGVVESGNTLYKEEIVYPQTPANIETSGRTFEFKWDDGSVAEGTPMPSSAVTVYGTYIEKLGATNIFYGIKMDSEIGANPDFETLSQTMSSVTLANLPEYLSMRVEGIPEYDDFEGEDEEWDPDHMYTHLIIVPEGKRITSYKVGDMTQPSIAGSRYEKSYGTVTIDGKSYDVYGYQRETYFVHEISVSPVVYITIE